VQVTAIKTAPNESFVHTCRNWNNLALGKHLAALSSYMPLIKRRIFHYTAVRNIHHTKHNLFHPTTSNILICIIYIYLKKRDIYIYRERERERDQTLTSCHSPTSVRARPVTHERAGGKSVRLQTVLGVVKVRLVIMLSAGAI
jgi:hypothetical protein